MYECGKVKKVLSNKIGIKIYSWTVCIQEFGRKWEYSIKTDSTQLWICNLLGLMTPSSIYPWSLSNELTQINYGNNLACNWKLSFIKFWGWLVNNQQADSSEYIHTGWESGDVLIKIYYHERSRLCKLENVISYLDFLMILVDPDYAQD